MSPSSGKARKSPCQSVMCTLPYPDPKTKVPAQGWRRAVSVEATAATQQRVRPKQNDQCCCHVAQPPEACQAGSHPSFRCKPTHPIMHATICLGLTPPVPQTPHEGTHLERYSLLCPPNIPAVPASYDNDFSHDLGAVFSA